MRMLQYQYIHTDCGKKEFKVKKFLALFLILALGVFAEYDRSEWLNPSTWVKTRKKVLQRDMKGSIWLCKYSGDTIPESRLVDIDHIIPLKYAYSIGGSEFSIELKHKFATDDSNLVSVGQHENRSKGDNGLSEYLPKVNTCWYYRHWKYMSSKYKLRLPRKDSTILAKGLRSCRDK